MTDAIRFCRSADGTQLGYSVLGQGRPLLVLPSWWMSPEADRQRLIGRDFWRELGSGRRIITYDLRGVGVSSRKVDDVSLDRQTEDLAAVIDHLGIPLIDLLCFSDSCATGITFAASNPGRVAHLALYNPCAYVPAPVGWRHISVWTSFIEADWALASRCLAQLLYPKGPLEAQESSTKSIRATQSPAVALKYLEFVNTYDVRSEMEKLSLPVLVISREGPGRTPLIPRETVQRVATAIPGATFIAYDAASAACPYYQCRPYLAAVRDFLADSSRELPIHPTLSPREIEVLGLVAKGKTNAEIAENLVISKNTADRHVSNILAKTGSANRAQAVLYAARHFLVG